MIWRAWRRWRRGARSDDEPEADTGLFQEIQELRNPVYEDPDDEKKKYNSTIFGRISASKAFEFATITMIGLNALEIGWDADYAARWKKPVSLYDTQGVPALIAFAVCENVFAVYFTAEILIRFLAYAEKTTSLSDGWFIFDTALVLLMVVETWILPFLGSGGPLAELNILRLIRLVRITRMIKLMRAVKELMLIVRGITAATRAVMWTAILLVIVSYTWAIIFTNEFHQGPLADEDVGDDTIEFFFGSMGKSMLSLLIMGTILDDVTACTDRIRSTGNFVMLGVFILYILLNSFTIMNMLVGILVEVVDNTAVGEKKRLAEIGVKESIKAISKMDVDKNGRISREEFMEMKQNPEVMGALSHLRIDHKQFDMYVELVFQRDPEPQIEELLEQICRLRPGTNVSALDFAMFKEHICMSQKNVRNHLHRIERMCCELSDEPHLLFPANTSGPTDTWTGEPATDLPLSDNHTPLPRRVSMDLLAELDRTPGEAIIEELQRRLGVPNLNESGLPMAMMDEDLQNMVKTAEAFQTLSSPAPDPQWSGETLIC